MADSFGFAIKGAALRQQEEESVDLPTLKIKSDPLNLSRAANKAADDAGGQPVSAGDAAETGAAAHAESKNDVVTATSDELEEAPQGEITDPKEAENVKRYRMCKCFFDEESAQKYGYSHYYTHMDTADSQWEEPKEPYWIWDTATRTIDFKKGLQYPGGVNPTQITYNPKIHGNYDPNAPYAQYHNKKLRGEDPTIPTATISAADPAASYEMTGSFNRFTGNFQRDADATEHHNQHNKAGRQLGAFYDTEAAANAHDGRSLKEERRNQKLTKQELKEMREKRKAKQLKKKTDWLKS